ncbi:type VII secretion protein EccE [Pilimelia columellifera]|uniref:Type VII secretion protein EccE n=1 Tax=Pilimelia columellifera subsp. columellifera TaxID=706583 RepID=A0ABP6A473_9ACTN
MTAAPAPSTPDLFARDRQVRRLGPRLGAGQLIVSQVALAAPVAMAQFGVVAVTAAATVAAVGLALTWLQFRRRWAYQWLGLWLSTAGHRRRLRVDADATALLDWICPGARIRSVRVAGEDAAVLADGTGLTAVFELGDRSAVLVDDGVVLPSVSEIAALAREAGPVVRAQLVVSAAPAPTPRVEGTPAAEAYRQLAQGRSVAATATLLAVRVVADEGDDPDDLLRSLSSTVRRIRRRAGIGSARLLGPSALAGALVQFAHHLPGQAGLAGWDSTRLGGLRQSCFRLAAPADPAVCGRLLGRLGALPALATTVSALAASGAPGGYPLAVRVAAADTVGLVRAARALEQVAAEHGLTLRRSDGEQLAGLAATLPLGGVRPPGFIRSREPRPTSVSAMRPPDAGLVVGVDRHGVPVLTRLFRAEPTRVLLAGGVRAAQLIALRALAVGGRLEVRTARPQAWAPFVRAATAPDATLSLVAPDAPATFDADDPLRPLLTVVDAGPVAHDPSPVGGWHSVLVVRDELTGLDTGAMTRADLVVLQPLRPDEAALAGSVLGLGAAAEWLTRIRPDMVGLVSRRTVRWAALAATPVEERLVGSPARD